MSGRACPCGTGEAYARCCGPVLAGTVLPATAEQLMRSRYTAFAVGDQAYLLASWHPSTRPPALSLDPAVRWERLEVLSADGGLFSATGTVAFRAHFRLRGVRSVQSEVSAFARVDGRWCYLAPAPG